MPHLSTGDLLRAAVAAGTPLGVEADGFMRRGQLVPDALVLRIIRERLEKADAGRGVLLDGYPRTLAQAEELDRITTVDLVAWFEVPSEALVARLAGRRLCPTCQRVYNVTTKPPHEAGRCDDDHSVLVQRPDDRPEAVAERLRVYARDTAPLLEHYRSRGLLQMVDASGSPSAVAEKFGQLLGRATRD